MKAIAFGEYNPSSYVTGRHHNVCLPYKPVSPYLTVGQRIFCFGMSACGVYTVVAVVAG
jgi:hypothetical protein